MAMYNGWHKLPTTEGALKGTASFGQLHALVSTMNFDRALIIAEPWIKMILEGKKIIEMRSKPTKIRGPIGLIRKGSGLIVGEANILSCENIPDNYLKTLEPAHCIDYSKNPELKKYNFAWFLKDIKKYDKPIPYRHPQGAVIWVKV